jgi:outer membrane protein
MRRFFPFLLALLVLLVPVSAVADGLKVGVVDFSRALNEISDGQQAQGRLESMLAGKRAEIEQMEANLVALQQEYESKSNVISESARRDYQQRMAEAQQTYQQAFMQSDAEMQQAYVQVMETLVTKLKTQAESVGRDQGLDLVLEASQGAVLFSAPALDITDEVIKRYNASGAK